MPFDPHSRWRWRAWSAVLACGLVCAPDAWGDERTDARRHFKRGMALIKSGKHLEGAEALEQAHAVKPHPDLLYNIARAYHSAGKLEEALNYFRRYIDTWPSDEESVRQQMAVLEQQLAEQRTPAQSPAAELKPMASEQEEMMRKLQALALRLESVLARAESTERAESGVNAEAASREAPELGHSPYEEYVVTASRRVQSTLEAPFATTVITAEEIRLSGARTLPELLRRVPGAEVMTMGVTSANVSFRGFNQRLANKVLVLVDGRPEYQDFLGLSLWPALAVGLEEIQRIEVIRGPGSALYGANAMLGVVNVITRTPGTGPRTEFTLQGGNGTSAGASLVASGGERLRYRASGGYLQSNKFSLDYPADGPDVRPAVEDPQLGFRGARAQLSTRYEFTRALALNTSAGVHRMYTEVYPVGLLRNFYLDGTSAFASTELSAGPARLKLFWNHLEARSGPQYRPIGQRSLDNRVESNVFDAEFLFGGDFAWLGQHRMDVGVSSRLKRVGWSYLPGLRSELHGAAFIQDEWRVLDSLRLVGSYRLDYHPLLDQGRPGYAHSPRASAVWRVGENHALRASFATAFRQPTFMESYTQVRTPLPGINGGSVLTEGNITLRPERLISYELGYRGESSWLGLDWDLALYQNDVSDLIGLSPLSPVAPEEAFDSQSGSFLLGRSTFINEPTAYVARGAEVGIKYSPTSGLDFRVSSAVQNITSTGPLPCGPCTQAPAFKVFAGASFRSTARVDFSVDGAYTTSTIWVEREPSQVDPMQVVSVQHPLPAYAVFNARVGYRLWSDSVSVAVVGTQLGTAHAEHPFGNRVEQRVLATLTVRP